MLATVLHCFALSTVCLGDVPEFARECTPVVVALVEEAGALRRNSPERWKEYEDIVEAIFEKRARRSRGWRHHKPPPRVDLSPANLPLSFLIVKAFGEGSRPRWCYFDAIIKSSDERRIDAVLGMHAEAPEPYRLEVGWGPLVASACTLERAAVLLPVILGERPDFHRLSLEFKLIDRFASELPAELRRAAYDYTRGWLKTEERDQNPKHLWDALFRLDRDRARHDSLAPPPEGLTTEQSGPVRLWLEYPGESMEVATWARKWLWEHEYPPDSLETTQWLDLILRSDPKGALLPTICRIEEIISHDPRRHSHETTQLSYLVQAMVAIDSDDALPHLLKYVHEPLVLAYMRVGVLEWLAGREYDSLPAVLARWLREDQHGGRDYLRQVAGSWGPYAVSCLEEADRINNSMSIGRSDQGEQPVP